METESMSDALDNGFSALTDENRKSVIDMMKFLVLTQNAIVPNILNGQAATAKSEKQGVCPAKI